ncbi:hypothetical protein HRG_007591 [Hirsutella rhossiliensis]|uniref:GTP binding protein n=1 Tax=Hirsutella rhossiliensis TaxID=111463 RepID=A0A9P8MST1_9HYPO|nr:uncharacterized protein HRG_07591 [Hirsutella rhossiliensis]KAH0961513.1 hypothetical protein HRG_07591 [Hirsutella rhossiliensis]
MMTPQEIEALLQYNGSGRPQDEHGDGSDSEPPAGDCEPRTALLLPVLSACKETWASGSEALDAMAQKLGDGSRDVAWRLPLGESGILDFFLTVLAEDNLRQGLQIHALRLVGNSCADTDQNRARVVAADRLSSVSRHLQDEALLLFTVPVLYNILVDYEPAQLLASRSRLSSQILAHLSLPNLSKHTAAVLYICRILALLVEQDGESSVADPSTANALFGLATSELSKEDVESFASIVEVAVAYLANEGFQSRLVAENHVGLFIDAFHHLHTNWMPNEVEDSDVATRLKQLRSALLTMLADLSGNDSFSPHYPLSSSVAQSFLAWIKGTNLALQTAACLALGNLSRSDEASVELVEKHAVHIALTNLLSSPAVNDSQLLHLALSFGRNLAIPSQNKVQLGDLLAPGCVPRILSLDTLPQVQFAAISLTRLLLLNCPPNVRRVCTPLSADPSSPDHERTSVAAIVSLFDRSDAEPTKLEAARSITALCRTLHSPASVEESKASHGETDGAQRRSLFYEKHDLSGALAFVVALQKWPTLRSEAWFILALMSRSTDGAAVVNAVLEVKAASDALVEAVTGRKVTEREAGSARQIQDLADTTSVDDATASLASGLQLEPQQADSAEQQASMTKADRENALILCAGLLRNGEGRLPPTRLSLLQGLVKEGTELVVADRSRG